MHPIEVFLEAGHQRLGLRATVHDPANHNDRVEHLLERALVCQEDGIAPLAQHSQGFRLEVGEAEDEVGLERFDAIESDRREGGNDRLLACLAGGGRVAGDTDDEVARAEPVEHIRRLGAQANDAAWTRPHVYPSERTRTKSGRALSPPARAQQGTALARERTPRTGPSPRWA